MLQYDMLICITYRQITVISADNLLYRQISVVSADIIVYRQIKCRYIFIFVRQIISICRYAKKWSSSHQNPCLKMSYSALLEQIGLSRVADDFLTSHGRVQFIREGMNPSMHLLNSSSSSLSLQESLS